MTWKAIDRYSKDYVELQTKDNVKFYKTPDSVLQKQLEIFDTVMDKKSEGQRALQGDHRVAEGIRRARGALGPRHLREPAHGVQPLLRQAGRARRLYETRATMTSHPAIPDGVCRVAVLPRGGR